MMLRSSSTPVLGSLLSASYSESPSSESRPTIKHPLPTTTIHRNPNNKLSFHHPTIIPFNSSPISPSITDLSINGFRRAHSDGNLQGLLVTASCNYDEFTISIPPKRFSRRPKCPALETIPSFLIHNARNRCENEDYSDEEQEEEEEEKEEEEENGVLFENSIEGEEKSMAVRGSKLDMEKQNLGLRDEMGFVKGNGSLLAFEEKIGAEMYLARGVGAETINIGFGGGGGGGRHSGGGGSGGAGGGDGDGPGIEEHYKRLAEENPGNPLFLRNYAQFLYETKGDLPRAEEFYSRAILADPKDGEVLSQYAKLVWELHGDQDRASGYFERAVCAAPQDSHVHAAYASFLWETEEETDEDDATNDPTVLSSNFHGAMASTTA